jgi:hypothetical protein
MAGGAVCARCHVLQGRIERSASCLRTRLTLPGGLVAISELHAATLVLRCIIAVPGQ